MDHADVAALGSLLKPDNAKKFIQWIRRCECVGIDQGADVLSASLEHLLPSLQSMQGGSLGDLTLPVLAAELTSVLNWSPDMNAKFEKCGLTGRRLQDWSQQRIQERILEALGEQPHEARRALDHLMLMKWARMAPGEDNDRAVFLQYRHCAVQDFLVPGLDFDLGRFAVDMQLLCAVPPAPPAHGFICEWLGKSDMQDGIAIETLRYAATLAQHLLIQLHCHLMKGDPDALEHGLFSCRGDSPFDELWSQLAVTAGSNLTLAVRRIR
jgi:hypothetical protein